MYELVYDSKTVCNKLFICYILVEIESVTFLLDYGERSQSPHFIIQYNCLHLQNYNYFSFSLPVCNTIVTILYT